MKKCIAGLMVVMFVVSVVFISYADDGPVKKLGRGIANVVTSPFEIPMDMGETKDESGIFAAFTWGLLKGTVDMVKRAVVGVYEIVTFPVPLPADYKPIIDDPEFILEKEKY